MNELNSIPLTTISGESKTFGDFPGKARLVVNVASQCGFTPQYRGLEALWRRYRDRGLVIFGFPCNQFGHQEPGNEAAIQNFCSLNYDLTFPMFAKVEVNGPNTHPLFAALKKAAPGLLGSQAIKWNFTKFLVGEDGSIRRFASTDTPEKLAAPIETLLT